MTTAAGTTFRLRALGNPELVDVNGHTPRALGHGKPLALLCYLAVRGEARRDEIVDLLWRDIDETKARNAFRQALHRLRTALGDDVIPRDRDRLRLGGPTQLVIDVAEFESAVTQGRLDQAFELYTGDFLDGFDIREPAFDLWADQERTRLRGRFAQVLRDGTVEASAAGRWNDAIIRAKRLLNLTPFDPDAARLAATTLVSAGQRTEALEVLRTFVAHMQDELDVAPRADVQALLARLEREASADPPASLPDLDAAETRLPGLPLIGRQPELARLLTLWRSLREDAGALVLIEGEHGIGKTRLVREVASLARSLSPALVLTGRERFAGAQLPFGIFGEALKPAVRAPGVAGASAHLLAEAARLLPEMRDAFDLPSVSPIEDEPSRLRFFEGIAALLDAAAYEQRTLLVLEDLQHVPPSSLDLLTYLATRLAGAPVMFLLTIAAGEAPAPVVERLRALTANDADAGPAGTPSGARALRLELGPLDSGDVEDALTKAATGTSGAGSIPLSAVGAVIRAAQSAGGGRVHPLQLMQAVRAAAAGEPLAAAPVPLRDLLHDRLHLLPSAHRRTFLALALLGRPADLRLLSASAHVSESAAREAAHNLEQLGWIESMDGDASIANELAAHVALDLAGPASRAFMAGWIADAVARTRDADDTELARLYAMAGRDADAFAHARRAGFHALAAGAVAEAVQLFGIARTFAATPEEERAMETALEAAGSGRRKLAAGDAPAPETTAFAEAVDTWPRSGQTATTPAPPPPVWWRRLFPHWQILLTAAVATAVITALALATRESPIAPSVAPADTLVLAESRPGMLGVQRYAIGSIAGGFAITAGFERLPATPPWVDSVARPWSHPLASPRGDRVALTRTDTASGNARLVILSADRRDTLRFDNLPGRDPVPLAWAPDGSRLLVAASRRPADGATDTDLFSLSATDPAAPIVVIDGAPGRSVTEAQWSPDGSHIAWVARTGPTSQLEIFVSRADGSEPRDVSRSSADDFHIAWSPAGDLLAFTSLRDGNPELYVADLTEGVDGGGGRLWRLTTDPADDDRATFAPSGRFIAFESTREGFGGVYVIPPLGGRTRPIAGRRPFDLAGWRAPPPRYVDRIRIEAVGLAEPGARGQVALRAFDRHGDSMAVQQVEWRILDTSVVQLEEAPDAGAAASRTLLARSDGIARVIATVGRWRADTAVVRVGDAPVELIDERFGPDWSRRWRALGDPAPVVVRTAGGAGLLLRAAGEWDSGILSRETVPLIPGLSVSATLSAPLTPRGGTGGTGSGGGSVTLSLAAPEDVGSVDVATPQLLRLVSLSWNGESRRLVYSVGREVFAELVDSAVDGDTLAATLRVESDSTVRFIVDGATRWRSRLRLSGGQFGTRALLWVSGRDTRDRVTVTRISAGVVSLRGSGSSR